VAFHPCRKYRPFFRSSLEVQNDWKEIFDKIH
jgi:hypothetical protein